MHDITIDTAELTYPWFWLPGILPHFLDGSLPGGVTVRLESGEYTFQQTRNRPSDLVFRVTADGTVDYAVEDDHLLGGRGTSTLHVLGVRVTLAADHEAPRPLPMWGGCMEPIGDPVRIVRMPPGSAYEIRLGTAPSDVVHFTVRPDGTVDYGAEYEAALSGRGTARLRLEPRRAC